MLMGALTTFAQQGYWFQSKFINFTPNPCGVFYVKSIDTSKGRETLKQELSNSNNITAFEESFSNGFMVKSDERPTIEGCYVSECYKTPRTEWAMVLPNITVRLNDGQGIEHIIKKISFIIRYSKRRNSLSS